MDWRWLSLWWICVSCFQRRLRCFWRSLGTVRFAARRKSFSNRRHVTSVSPSQTRWSLTHTHIRVLTPDFWRSTFIIYRHISLLTRVSDNNPRLFHLSLRREMIWSRSLSLGNDLLLCQRVHVRFGMPVFGSTWELDMIHVRAVSTGISLWNCTRKAYVTQPSTLDDFLWRKVFFTSVFSPLVRCHKQTSVCQVERKWGSLWDEGGAISNSQSESALHTSLQSREWFPQIWPNKSLLFVMQDNCVQYGDKCFWSPWGNKLNYTAKPPVLN